MVVLLDGFMVGWLNCFMVELFYGWMVVCNIADHKAATTHQI